MTRRRTHGRSTSPNAIADCELKPVAHVSARNPAQWSQSSNVNRIQAVFLARLAQSDQSARVRLPGSRPSPITRALRLNIISMSPGNQMTELNATRRVAAMHRLQPIRQRTISKFVDYSMRISVLALNPDDRIPAIRHRTQPQTTAAVRLGNAPLLQSLNQCAPRPTTQITPRSFLHNPRFTMLGVIARIARPRTTTRRTISLLRSRLKFLGANLTFFHPSIYPIQMIGASLSPKGAKAKGAKAKRDGVKLGFVVQP